MKAQGSSEVTELNWEARIIAEQLDLLLSQLYVYQDGVSDIILKGEGKGEDISVETLSYLPVFNDFVQRISGLAAKAKRLAESLEGLAKQG